MLGILHDPACQVLVAAMDACALRNQVIASNVANADTPGYRRAYVQFEDTLKQMLDADRTPEPGQQLSAVETDHTPSTRLDGNNVNIDTEMADLARTSIEYNALIELRKLKSGLLTTVISGGAR